MPSVTIIFPVLNSSPATVQACLHSIRTLTYPKSQLQVIIIDNGSTNQVGKFIHKKFPWVKIITNPTNVGFAAALNQGIRQAKTPLVFVGNDDLVLTPTSLTQLVKFLTLHPQVKITGPFGYCINRWTGHVHPCVHPQWIQGCALLTYRQHLLDLGLLSTSSLLYFEDAQLGFDTLRQGHQLAVCPTAKFFHTDSTTSNKNPSRKFFNWYLGKLHFIHRNFPLPNQITMLCLLAFAVIIRPSHILPYVRAIATFTHFRQ